jgi:hypothetical protein
LPIPESALRNHPISRLAVEMLVRDPEEASHGSKTL